MTLLSDREHVDRDDDDDRQRRNQRRHRWYCWILIVIVLAWIASAGKILPYKHWPSYYDYYCELADAFIEGQLHLRRGPDPKLLALPDPYDPVAGYELKRHDLVLYEGKYYLYWGPVPALAYVPLRLAFGRFGTIKDTYLVFWFAAGIVLVSGALMARIRERFFPQGSHAIVLLAMVAAGLALPLPYLHARAAVYEAAILGGQLFLLTGIYFALTAFFDPAERSADVGVARLCCAGGAWALAVGSRVSLAPAVAGLALLVVYRLCTTAPRRVRYTWTVRMVIAFGAPLAIGVMLLGWYNFARFGSFLETGQRYQLAGFHLGKLGPYLFSVHNVLPNLFGYAIRPWRALEWFPYVMPRTDPAWIPPFVKRPPYYFTEHTTGLLWTTPIILVCIVPIWRLIGRSRSAPGLKWLVLCLFCAAGLGFVPALMLPGTTMRYFADGMPSMFVLMAIGLWQIEQLLTGGARRHTAFLIVTSLCVAYSAAIAIFLATTGPYDHFKRHNPDLLRRLIRWFPGEIPRGERLPSVDRPVHEDRPA